MKLSGKMLQHLDGSWEPKEPIAIMTLLKGI
jgi:hypothetical protein